MLLDIFTADNKIFAILSFLIAFPALLFSLSIHEYAHGLAAYKQGDGFAKLSGRLTLNPFKHIDPIGTLAMLLIGFGWAKPVPVVPNNFKNGKKSMLIVSFAGVIANLILATFSFFLLFFFQYIITPNILWFQASETGVLVYFVIYYVFYYLIILNINLAVFNLMPIPPLDGYKIFKEFFIGRINYNFFSNIERYSTYVLLAFLLVGNRIGIIPAISGFIFELMYKVMELIFIAFI
ncbi:MAG: site-2 protease family protein [Clostridiales bacterium]|nr:site-2 protease family protein [Clostridiales bacterium]